VKLPRFLKKGRQIQHDDYLAWELIDPAFDHVAIDSITSVNMKCEVVYPKDRPVAYISKPVIYTDSHGLSRWMTIDPIGALPVPRLVPDAAIIGPLPKSEDSLRSRPGIGRRS
jgi:hypothetical protein